jgi:hypothetical protein
LPDDPLPDILDDLPLPWYVEACPNCWGNWRCEEHARDTPR